jgi:TP901 family phage tail tape measure protein
MVNEQANVKVTLNSQEAQRELEALQNEMKRLIALKRKAEQAGDVEGYKRIDKELKKVTRESNKLVREHRDLDRIIKNLSGASINELRDAQRALSSQTSKLNRNTDEYVKKKAQLKLVRQELAKVNAEYRVQQTFLGRAAGAFNKYFGVITAGLASIAGLSFTIRQAINDYSAFDDKLADVMKTTGLTKDQVKELNLELKKIDTRTSQEELLNLARVAGKLGITVKEEILGFVRAADQIVVALGEDLGGAEDAVRELGKLTDIFKLKELYGQEQSLLKVGSAINELGMASTANEGYLVEFSKRTAGIAPQAGISIQSIFGLAATLDALGQKAEMSSTAYSKLMTTMTKKTAEFARIAGMGMEEFTRLMEEDANEAMIRVFEGINRTKGGFQQMVATLGDLGVDGQRMTSVFGALANNTEMLREQQRLANEAFREGTSLTNEFNIKNNTAQGNLEKARKSFAEIRRELGEKLIPAYTSVISKARLMLNFLSALIDVLEKHGKTILVAGTALVAYTAYVKIHNTVQSVYNRLTATGTTLTQIFNKAIKSNPIGLLISLLTAAATAYMLFRDRTKEASRSQTDFNKVVEQGNNLLAQTKSLEERASIVKNLSKEQLENLKSDIQIQIQQEEDFHASLLQKLKKRLDEDEQLKILYERRSQQELTEIQKINLDAQINARKQAIARDMEDQNKANQRRLTNLRTYLSGVDTELKKRPDSQEPTGIENIDFETTEKALESAFAKEQNLLKQQLLENKLTRSEFNQEMYALELAHLTAMRELYRSYGSDIVAIEGQIMDKKLAWQQQMDSILSASVQITEAIAEEERKMFEDIDQEMENHLAVYTQSLDKETKATIDAELKKQEAREKARQAQIADAVFMAESAVENAETVEEAASAILNSIRKQIRAYLAEFVATAAIKAMKGVPFPLNIAAAAVAGGAATFLFNKLIPEFSSGGFTGYGGKMEPAGIVHKKEYVIPREGTANPNLRPLIDLIEIARRNGSLSRLDLTPLVQQIPFRQFTDGGYTSRPSSGTAASLPASITSQNIDNELKELIRQNLVMMQELKKHQPVVAVETIERERDKYIKIKQTSGL